LVKIREGDCLLPDGEMVAEMVAGQGLRVKIAWLREMQKVKGKRKNNL